MQTPRGPLLLSGITADKFSALPPTPTPGLPSGIALGNGVTPGTFAAGLSVSRRRRRRCRRCNQSQPPICAFRCPAWPWCPFCCLLRNCPRHISRSPGRSFRLLEAEPRTRIFSRNVVVHRRYPARSPFRAIFLNRRREMSNSASRKWRGHFLFFTSFTRVPRQPGPISPVPLWPRSAEVSMRTDDRIFTQRAVPAGRSFPPDCQTLRPDFFLRI